MDGRMGSVLGGRVTVLVCLLRRGRRGFPGLVRGRGLPDLLDEHLQQSKAASSGAAFLVELAQHRRFKTVDTAGFPDEGEFRSGRVAAGCVHLSPAALRSGWVAWEGQARRWRGPRVPRGDPDPQRRRPDCEPQRRTEFHRLDVHSGVDRFRGTDLQTRRAPGSPPRRRRQVHGSSPHLLAPACNPRARGDLATRRC